MLTNESKVASETTLATTTSSPPCPPGGCTENPGAHDGDRGGGGGHRRHCGRNNRGHDRNGCGGQSGDNTTSTRTPSTPQGPWFYFNPYTQVTLAWRGAGLLGLGPSAYQSAYATSFTPLQMPSTHLRWPHSGTSQLSSPP
jgi:hypothetical protein